MSKTKTSKEERIEILRQEFDHKVTRYSREVEKYTAKMNEDFEYFFRWYAADMYKAHHILGTLCEISPAIALWEDSEKINLFLKGYIQNIELTLIEGSQYPSSSSIMHNASEILKREAKQELRQILLELTWTLED